MQVIIGYAKGSNGRRGRPLFARRPEQLEQLVLDDTSALNLAVYLRKPEIKRLGKAGVVATPAILRSVLQLAAENQYRDSEALFLAMDAGGAVLELSTADQIAAFVASAPGSPAAFENGIQGRNREDRFAFWQQELERCIRCYACRASCPMCYCEQCLAESNQPQWVPVPAHLLGNFEWHVSRAMHLAGRCVACGACTEACPVGIPLKLINEFLRDLVAKEFRQRAGSGAKLDYPLSVFSVKDREEFIK